MYAVKTKVSFFIQRILPLMSQSELIKITSTWLCCRQSNGLSNTNSRFVSLFSFSSFWSLITQARITQLSERKKKISSCNIVCPAKIKAGGWIVFLWETEHSRRNLLPNENWFITISFCDLESTFCSRVEKSGVGEELTHSGSGNKAIMFFCLVFKLCLKSSFMYFYCPLFGFPRIFFI